jgi:CHAT domain-containing protein
MTRGKTITCFALAATLLPAWSPAVAWKNQIADRAVEAETLFSEARVLVQDGRFIGAQRKLHEASKIWQEIGNPARAAHGLLEIGEQFKRDRWQQAIEIYLGLLKIKPLEPAVRTAALISLGDLYARFGALDLAVDYYRKALDSAVANRDSAAQAEALTGLAATHCEEKQFIQSKLYLNRARQIYEAERNRAGEAKVLRLIGELNRDQGKLDQARVEFEKALAIVATGGSAAESALLLFDLSDTSLVAGDKQKALDYASSCLTEANASGDWEMKWKAWLALARAQRALGRTRDALNSYQRSFITIEAKLLHPSVDALAIAFLEKRQAPYRELADLFIETGDIASGYKMAQYCRARATLDTVSAAQRHERRGMSPEKRLAVRQTTQSIISLRAKLATDLDAVQRAGLQAQLEEAERRKTELLIEAQLGRLKSFTRPASLKEVQESLLDPNDVIVEFFLGDQRSFVWFITRGDAKYIVLPPRAEIEKKVSDYIALVSAKPSNQYLDREMAKVKASATSLHNLIFGRAGGVVQPGRRLIIVPDGLFYYLPFETLVHDDSYLIENCVIGYSPSVSVLALLRQQAESAGQMELLAFGDAVFSQPIGGVRGNEAAGARLTALPNTRNEVLSISQQFPSNRVRLFLGSEASEQRLKAEALRTYKRVHIATHGLIDELHPSRSGVALSAGDDADEDGFLEVQEIIADLDIDSDLVVLSACQTGRGQLLRGEGLLGLTRAFLYAGARSVVVSLWKVSDVATTDFMKLFYRHLGAGMPATDALRRSKLEMIATRRAVRHPYYWSAFVLEGRL